MPEYTAAEVLMSKLQLSRQELALFESENILHPVHKNGRTFYSSRDCYDAKGILHFMREENLPFAAAQERFYSRMEAVQRRGGTLQHAT